MKTNIRHNYFFCIKYLKNLTKIANHVNVMNHFYECFESSLPAE